MDVSDLSKWQFSAIVFNDARFEMHLHPGRTEKKGIGRDVALTGAKALLAAHQGLVEHYEAMIELMEIYDETDIQEMIEAVHAYVSEKKKLHDLYRQHMNRHWIADRETLNDAFWAWNEADSKVTKTALDVYRLFVGPIPENSIPPIPLELWTDDIIRSRYFDGYMRGPLCKMWGMTTSKFGKWPGSSFRSHSDLVRFMGTNRYRLNEDETVAFNHRGELVGRIKRMFNSHGEDAWLFKSVHIYINQGES